MKPTIKLLITDLDDTIWYWFKMWHASFSAQLDEVAKVSGISKDVLIPEIKAIHEKYHTSEYSFVLQETNQKGSGRVLLVMGWIGSG